MGLKRSRRECKHEHGHEPDAIESIDRDEIGLSSSDVLED